MVRKDLFCRAGGFDPKFSLAEDFDLLLRISREVPVDYIDEPLLFYREHRESGTSTKIDRITSEALEILRSWREKDPSVFRKHFLKYQKFRMNFAVPEVQGSAEEMVFLEQEPVKSEERFPPPFVLFIPFDSPVH